MQNWANPPEIRQELGARKKYFLPARQLSNPPEFSKICWRKPPSGHAESLIESGTGGVVVIFGDSGPERVNRENAEKLKPEITRVFKNCLKYDLKSNHLPKI
jgi:hypothetical protein